MDPPTLLPLHCLNCGNTLSYQENYCPECGQRNREPVLPVSKFISDFLQDYISFDSRFFRSVYLLIFKPGIMTREFNAGRRLRYIPPLRLYIFTSFIYFFVLALSTEKTFNFGWEDDGMAVGFENAIAALDSIAADSLNEADRAELLRIKQGLENLAPVIDKGRAVDHTTDTLEAISESEFSKKLRDKIEYKGERLRKNPELFRNTLFRAISISVFFLLPIFAMLLWITHMRRAKYYVEHLVHSLHFHTFTFFLFLFALAGAKLGFQAFWLLIPASFGYFVLSLRNTYKQGLTKALLKAILIVPVYTIVIAIVLLIAVLVGALLA
jgi:hypothetical protein